jgi:DNA-binding transcriptional LysR family regulator
VTKRKKYPYHVSYFSFINNRVAILGLEAHIFASYISFMKNIDWQDIKFFVAVARGGGLTPASQSLEASPATVGRRMLSLERQLARKLFVRRQSGYELTPDGRKLLSIALSMEADSRPIEAWLEAEHRRPAVRLSTGTWTSNFICENFSRLWTPNDPFCLALHTTELRLDIARREVDIGIRSHKPEEPSLAVRKTGEVAHAAFRARQAAGSSRSKWIAIVSEQALTQSTRWVSEQPDLDIVAWANTPRTLYDMVRAGIGNGVIPCFAGDRDPMLERASAPMPLLLQEQWLVMHDEGRHDPHVRTVIDRLADLLIEHASLFSGLRPLGADIRSDISR